MFRFLVIDQRFQLFPYRVRHLRKVSEGRLRYPPHDHSFSAFQLMACLHPYSVNRAIMSMDFQCLAMFTMLAIVYFSAYLGDQAADSITVLDVAQRQSEISHVYI